MRTAGGGKGSLFETGVRVTPSMRRKVEDLARWLAAGDASQVREARAAVVALLRDAARRTLVHRPGPAAPLGGEDGGNRTGDSGLGTWDPVRDAARGAAPGRPRPAGPSRRGRPRSSRGG